MRRLRYGRKQAGSSCEQAETHRAVSGGSQPNTSRAVSASNKTVRNSRRQRNTPLSTCSLYIPGVLTCHTLSEQWTHHRLSTAPRHLSPHEVAGGPGPRQRRVPPMATFCGSSLPAAHALRATAAGVRPGVRLGCTSYPLPKRLPFSASPRPSSRLGRERSLWATLGPSRSLRPREPLS